jgi:hypothetical protein
LIIGVLGGSSGTTYDAFKLVHDAQKYGRRAALFGRKINNAEHQLAFIELLRRIVDGEVGPGRSGTRLSRGAHRVENHPIPGAGRRSSVDRNRDRLRRPNGRNRALNQPARPGAARIPTRHRAPPNRAPPRSSLRRTSPRCPAPSAWPIIVAACVCGVLAMPPVTQDREARLARIAEHGVVGCGGAGFPAHVKLAATAECIILNAAECEPLLHKDKELLRHRGAQVIAGLSQAAELVGATDVVIGIKGKYADVIEQLTRDWARACASCRFPTAIPAGTNSSWVYDVTGRIVPPGGIPLDCRMRDAQRRDRAEHRPRPTGD